MSTLTLEKKMFQNDLATRGLPVAQRQANVRKIHDNMLTMPELEDIRPKACHHCTTTMFCGVCSKGAWIK